MKNNSYKGQMVRAINVLNQPAGRVGVIQYCDSAGRFYVLWENGSTGVIRERGDTYAFVDITQKNIWKFGNLILILRNKLNSLIS